MTKSGLVAAIAALAVTPLLAKSGGKQGTNILHFSVKVPFVNDDNTGSNSAAGASGTVTAAQATQGNADKETVTIAAKGLTPSTPYDVLISTTSSGLTPQGNGPFDSDKKGNLNLKLSNSAKLPKNGVPLTATPVSSIVEVDIETDSNSAPVLTADFTNATTLQYLVKQNISSDTGTNGGGVTATLNIKSTLNKGTSKSLVSVNASGLQAGAEYELVFNGSPTSNTAAASSKGTLKISSSDTPPNILDLTSVDLADSNGIPVTATATLP